jgi:hypothetical protein
MYQLVLGLSCFLCACYPCCNVSLYITVLACTRHFVYLISPERDSPLAPFISPNPSQTQWSKPAIVLFSLLHMTLQAGFGVLFCTKRQEAWLTERGLLPLPFQLSYRVMVLTSGMIPALSFVMGRDWPTVIWWCMAGAMGMFGQTLRRWMEQGDVKIEQLGQLRYVAPGA